MRTKKVDIAQHMKTTFQILDIKLKSIMTGAKPFNSWQFSLNLFENKTPKLFSRDISMSWDDSKFEE